MIQITLHSGEVVSYGEVCRRHEDNTLARVGSICPRSNSWNYRENHNEVRSCSR